MDSQELNLPGEEAVPAVPEADQQLPGNPENPETPRMKQQITGCFAILKTIFTDVIDCREENDYEEAELAAPHLDWRYSKEQLRLLETIERNRHLPGDRHGAAFLTKENHAQFGYKKNKQEELFLKVVTSTDLPDFITLQLAEQIRNNDVKGALRSSVLICTLQPGNGAALHLAHNLQARIKQERNAILMGIHGLHGHGGHGHGDMHEHEHGMHHSPGHSSNSSRSSESSSTSDASEGHASESTHGSSSDISY